MTYEEKEDSREVILVGYYNVLFYLIFRVGLDEYKKDILIERIRSGERMVMKDIYRWCEGHQVPFWTKFIYRKDFSVKANLWNLYSYCRFVYEIRGTHYNMDNKIVNGKLIINCFHLEVPEGKSMAEGKKVDDCYVKVDWDNNKQTFRMY